MEQHAKPDQRFEAGRSPLQLAVQLSRWDHVTVLLLCKTSLDAHSVRRITTEADRADADAMPFIRMPSPPVSIFSVSIFLCQVCLIEGRFWE